MVRMYKQLKKRTYQFLLKLGRPLDFKTPPSVYSIKSVFQYQQNIMNIAATLKLGYSRLYVLP